MKKRKVIERLSSFSFSIFIGDSKNPITLFSSTGSQEVDGNSTRGSKKGLFQGKLCLGKTRRRRNSVGTMSSVSDSFRTVTPLNSDEEGAAGFADESFDGGSLPSSIKTSTPKKGNILMKKGKTNY